MSSDSASGAAPPREHANWPALTAAALDRVVRPLFLVSREGRVLAMNRAFRELVGRAGARLDGARWGELFLDAAGEAPAPSLDPNASGDVMLRSGPLFERALALRLHVEVNEHDPGGALIVDVISSCPLDPALPKPVVTREYVVASAAHARGKLRQPGDVDGREGGEEGPYCYEALHAKSEPCAGCPVFDDTSELPVRRALVPSSARETYCVVEVSSLDRERLQVQSTCLAKEVVSELVQAKIAWLSCEGGLTAREREVLELLYVGRCTRDIAMLLDVSERTVKYHQANVLRKLGADSRADLVRLLL